MKQEIKERWVKALRSGEYKQTQFCLKDADGFCCLGVLVEVVREDLGLEWKRKHDEGDLIETEGIEVPKYKGQELSSYDTRIETGILPQVVSDYCGITNASPEVMIYREMGGVKADQPSRMELIDLNDNEGWTFAQIADAIEESNL